MKDARRAPLQEVERAALNHVVSKMRTVLTRELGRVLEGTFGIKTGGADPEAESRLKLDPDQLVSRRELVDLWEAFGRRADLLIREAAFTHVNRLIAVRVAETIGLLPESLARGRRSSGFRQLLEVAPLLGSDDDAGYWQYLELCGDELAHDIPRLFDPRNPLLSLRPPPSVVDELVGLISDDDLGGESEHGSAWAAPDTFGWTYQFFNSDEERTEMRRRHPQPVDSWELAVRNQFFTPDYVVDFLVHNSLGRRLIEAGNRELVYELDYLVDPPKEPGEPLELRDVKVLDPACGSGHFLLGAFEVLERAWGHRGVRAVEAAASIVGSLWGIDIDPRAAQVASAAIMFRARRNNLDGELPSANIVCARAVPGGPAGRAALLASVDSSQRDFLAEVIDQLDRAPELGSLLKVDGLLVGETARLMTFGGGGRRVAQRKSKDDPNAASLMDIGILTGALDVGEVVNEVLAVARAAADKVTSTPAERVLAAEGGDALQLVRVLSQRYDAVLMNPPFGEPIPGTKTYLKTNYPWIPTRDYNLFAGFVGRGLELCNGSGYLGAITSRAGMFLTTFERWREQILLGNDLTVLADLGHKVMHEALVEAAAYVVRPGQTRHDAPATFIRLLREPPERRPGALREACSHLRSGSFDERVFRVVPAEFDAIPGAPMAYWMSADIRRLFTDYPSLEGSGAEVRVGLQTGDDFRFVRTFWEVDPTRIGQSREETFGGKRWVPFAKGGEYSPFWADIHLVVEYEGDGAELREFPGSVIRNPQYYFRPGLTWPERTTSGFGVRVLPEGCCFSHVGHGAFALHDPLDLLCYLTSRVAQSLVLLFMGSAEETMSGSPAKRYAVGVVQRLPWPNLNLKTEERNAVSQLVRHRATEDSQDETTRLFGTPSLPAETSFASSIATSYYQSLHQAVDDLVTSNGLETVVARAFQLSGEAQEYIDAELGSHPASYPKGAANRADLGRLFVQPLDRTIDEFVTAAGGSRAISNLTFVCNRRLEVLAHGLELHPASIVEIVESEGWLPAGHLESKAIDVLSYLVGCSFGRWDVRFAHNPPPSIQKTQDPFDPVPLFPPGMLMGIDGLPARTVPKGYPLQLTDHRLLIDEPGHKADISSAVEAAAAALTNDPRTFLNELAEHLSASDLRSYIARRFFKHHFARYSKSRRKAPIYWPFTIPSRLWTVWVYAPTLSRETIYAVTAHAERRLNAAEVEIRRMESAQLQSSVPGTAGHDAALVRSLAARLDVERRAAEEIRVFRRIVTRVAESGWSPDLDDGIVLCAAPFAEVFLDWSKELTDMRKQLRAGKFPWSSIHRYRGAL